jgi:hypothetical protein
MYSAQLPFMEDNRYQRFYSLMASCDTHSTVYSVATSVRSRRITSANNTCPRQLFIFPMGLPTRASRLCSPHLSEMTVHAAFFLFSKKTPLLRSFAKKCKSPDSLAIIIHPIFGTNRETFPQNFLRTVFCECRIAYITLLIST